MIRNTSVTRPRKCAVDLRLKEGYFVKAASGLVALVAATADRPYGVVSFGQEADHDSGIVRFNHPGTVSVKLAATPGTVIMGTRLVCHSDGTVKALPATAGTYWYVGEAEESGVGDEVIEATLHTPEKIIVS